MHAKVALGGKTMPLTFPINFEINTFLFPRQVGRGDGELGDKVAKESEEKEDLLVGNQRLENKDDYCGDDFFLSMLIVMTR